MHSVETHSVETDVGLYADTQKHLSDHIWFKYPASVLPSMTGEHRGLSEITTVATSSK